MAPVSEGKRKAEFLVSEASGHRSREVVTVTVPASTTIPAGRIMGQITSSGKYVVHDADGTDDGRRTPVAVLYDNVTNDTGDAVDYELTVIARDAEVNNAHLTHDPAGDAAANAADLVALASVGIIGR